MYAVTGASGPLGHLTIESLLASGVTADQIVAVVRTTSKADDLAARGVVVRHGDYDDPATLTGALAGVERLLLVSGNEPGRRMPQHTAVVDAAVAAGVRHLAYTSATRADTTRLVLAPEHKATEELIVASGLSYTFLRNSWYHENYTRQLGQYLAQGAVVSAAGDGRVSGASRADYAAAASATLVGDGHDNKVYELGGPAYTMADLAATISEVAGTEVVDKEVSNAELIEILRGAGMDEGTAGFVAALDEATARGDLEVDPSVLEGLLGRPVTPLVDVVRAAYQAL